MIAWMPCGRRMQHSNPENRLILKPAPGLVHLFRRIQIERGGRADFDLVDEFGEFADQMSPARVALYTGQGVQKPR